MVNGKCILKLFSLERLRVLMQFLKAQDFLNEVLMISIYFLTLKVFLNFSYNFWVLLKLFKVRIFFNTFLDKI